VESRNTALRTVDVARRAGCSVQQVRNLEQAGVLPPTTRTPAGYRTYTHVHVLAAVAYVALSAGVGPVQAKTSCAPRTGLRSQTCSALSMRRTQDCTTNDKLSCSPRTRSRPSPPNRSTTPAPTTP